MILSFNSITIKGKLFSPTETISVNTFMSHNSIGIRIITHSSKSFSYKNNVYEIILI